MTTTDFNNRIAYESDFLKPYANSLTKDAEAAKDLFQETMMRALQNRTKYKVGTNIKAWLYTIMRNIFINDYRKSKRFTKVASDVPQDIVIHMAKGTMSTSGWNNVRMAEIKDAVSNLPAAYRQSFELYQLGYKYQDIADILNEPLGTIKSRIHFARKILMSKLDR